MKNVFSFLLLLSLSVTTTLFAGNVQITVRLKNGDVVTGKAALSKISIVNPYGTLNIPVEKITNMKLGIPSDKTKDGAVLPDLNKLQSVKTEEEAKPIYERLLAYGTPVLSSVLTFTQNPFYKISDLDNYTIEQLTDELYKKANLPSGQSINDAVSFDGVNTIEGSIAFSEVTIQSEYGTLTFKREKIESMDISTIDENAIVGDGNYKLKANYYISGNENNKGWLNTGVSVINGDKFSISANGKIILKSLSGGTYGPDGYLSGVKDAAYSDGMEIKYGSLVYKIGENGVTQPVGSKLEGTAAENGNIYISIYETVYDKTNTGAYNVRVLKK
ncbi:MAG: hypothetical protein IPM95_04785 [Sphingobacteriales bacterium]|jgi:hypothetical protein|nr:hypothetical protein [Sphingobacteriales bacterium]